MIPLYKLYPKSYFLDGITWCDLDQPLIQALGN